MLRPGIERLAARFAGHAYDRHAHDAYALGLTLSGTQCFGYRGSRWASSQGQVMILHPDEAHDGEAGTKGGFAYRMVYVDPAFLAGAFASLGRRELPFCPMPVQRDAALAAAVEDAFAGERPVAPRATDLWPGELWGTDLWAADWALRLAGAVSRLAGRPAAPVAPSAAVARARRLIDEADDAGAEALERECGLDRFTLTRHFRAAYGTTPYRRFLLRRLGRARRMLAAGAAIADTAAACGFADQPHLTRQFRAAYGLTPGRFRRLVGTD
ncbi:MAG: AraC family transcriptional regulator [Thalassobaculales bacterium]